MGPIFRGDPFLRMAGVRAELGAARLARRRSFTGGDLHKFEPNAA
jgi:hypothetical protein